LPSIRDSRSNRADNEDSRRNATKTTTMMLVGSVDHSVSLCLPNVGVHRRPRAIMSAAVRCNAMLGNLIVAYK